MEDAVSAAALHLGGRSASRLGLCRCRRFANSRTANELIYGRQEGDRLWRGGFHRLPSAETSGRGRLYEALYSVDIAEPRFPVAGVNLVSFDIREPIPAKLCGDGPFDIYNLAAVHTTPGHEDWEYYWTNVRGATNVCRFASELDAAHILFTSTMMVYGPTEAPKDEDAALEPVNAYGRSKILAEGIHNLWQAERPELRRLTTVPAGRHLRARGARQFHSPFAGLEGPALLLSRPNRHHQGLRLCR